MVRALTQRNSEYRPYLFHLLFLLLFTSHHPYSLSTEHTTAVHTTAIHTAMPAREPPSPPPPPSSTIKRVRRKGPMDPPGNIALTPSELAKRKQVIPGLPPPPLGFERKFQLRPVVHDGGLDERSEVGVLKYKMGNEVGKYSLL
jgi:hypothetical protein